MPFFIETESSIAPVGAVLAQKKVDRKRHPIQYASITMKTVAKKYSACKRETLAVIFALKKLLVYLLSTITFNLSTYHQELQYAFKNKAPDGRLELVELSRRI